MSGNTECITGRRRHFILIKVCKQVRHFVFHHSVSWVLEYYCQNVKFVVLWNIRWPLPSISNRILYSNSMFKHAEQKEHFLVLHTGEKTAGDRESPPASTTPPPSSWYSARSPTSLSLPRPSVPARGSFKRRVSDFIRMAFKWLDELNGCNLVIFPRNCFTTDCIRSSLAERESFCQFKSI